MGRIEIVMCLKKRNYNMSEKSFLIVIVTVILIVIQIK